MCWQRGSESLLPVVVDTRKSTHSADQEYSHLIEYTKTTKMLPQ